MGESYEETSAYPIGLVVAAADRLTSLRAIFVGDLVAEEAEISWIEQSDVTALLTAFPDLTHLGVRGGTDLTFPPVKHDSLRGLVIESGAARGGAARRARQRASLAGAPGSLARGLLVRGRRGRPGHGAAARGYALPRLRHLGLRNSEIQNEIASAIGSAPVVAQLRTLDLSNGTLGDEGAAALLEGQPLTHLASLDLHHHFLTEPMERRVADSLEPHGVTVDLSGRCEPWDDNGPEGRYTAVAE